MIRFNSPTGTITSVTDTRGNTWVIIGSLVRSNGSNVMGGAMYYCVANGSGANTVTVALSGSFGNTLDIAEWTTPHTQLDQHTEVGGNGSAPNSGNLTSTATGLIMGGVGRNTDASDFTSLGTGWTKREPASGSQRAFIGDQLDVAAGTYSMNLTWGGTPDWTAHVASFITPSAATKAPPPPRRPYRFFSYRRAA